MLPSRRICYPENLCCHTISAAYRVAKLYGGAKRNSNSRSAKRSKNSNGQTQTSPEIQKSGKDMTRKRTISWLIAVVLLVLPLEVMAASTAASAGDTLAAKAVASMQELESYQKYVDQISVSDLSNLPVGLKKKFGSASVTVAVSQAKFMANYTQLTVFCKLTLPQNDSETNKPKELYFGASNVKLSHGGGVYENDYSKDCITQPFFLALLRI